MPDKYEEEIEEILRGLGDATPSGPGAEKPLDDAPVAAHQEAPPYDPPNSSRGFWRSLWQPGKLAVIGLVLLASGLLVPVLRPFVWIGLGFLVIAYLLFFIRPRSINVEKRWRGKALEPEPTNWDKFKRWLKN